MKSEQGEGDNMAGGGSVVKCQSQTMAYLRTELYLDLRANIRIRHWKTSQPMVPSRTYSLCSFLPLELGLGKWST